MGVRFARRVPAGSHAGVLVLCLLDPLLLLITFIAVARTFGARSSRSARA